MFTLAKLPHAKLPLSEAAGHLSDCLLCPHRCGPQRATGSGRCRVGNQSYIASEMLHMGEEPPLRPAHAIFFSGCTAICTFCTASRFAFHPQYGVVVTPELLAQRVLQRQKEGARSLCFIGGDPVPHIPFILQTLSVLGGDRTVPAVFNSNLYMTDEALNLLEPAIDIYLPDLKFGPDSGPDSCGERIGGMPDYWNVVSGNMEALIKAGERLIVRHLLMPGHFDCCSRPALTWLARFPGLEVSLLTQYVPPANSHGSLARQLSPTEVDNARSLAHSLGLRLL